MTPSGDIVVRAEREYTVRVGQGIVHELPLLIPHALRVAVVIPESPEHLASQAHSQVVEPLRTLGHLVYVLTVPAGEGAKEATVLQHCWDLLGCWGFTRSDAIVALGGGTVTDLAGFLAATWLRGIRYVQIPTTLLAMVDASVGGKTGINTGSGKNLVGSFHSPVGVLCDLGFLRSLSLAERQSGMAEVVKVGLTSDLGILDLITEHGPAVIDPEAPALTELIERAIAVKARVVSSDFREIASDSAPSDLGREVLNYGHTLGHAIERIEGYTWRHGAAIAVGMMFAAELARLGGYLTAGEVDLHRTLLTTFQLPVSYASDQWPQLLEAMYLDKKSRGNTLRFVVLHGLGNPQPWRDPDRALLDAAFAALQQ